MSSTDSPVPSAADLRKLLLEKELEEMKRQEAARAAEQQQRTDAADHFLKEHVTEQERAIIKRLVMHAVEKGEMEAMVYSFPSDLCTDGGRAINSNDPAWPETLQGKARELYEGYKKTLQPNGYKLKAMIINFPGGIPGDVGFYLSWAPEKL